jgi:hypothetical protein
MLPKKQTRAILWLLGLLIVACSLSVRGQGVVALPSSLYLYTVSGNTNSLLPFGYPNPSTIRYQQVYDASQFTNAANASGDGDLIKYFSAITNGGWISDVYFRAATYACPFVATVSNVEIHLSTTSRAPDGLSPVFSENTGPDDTLVFSGSFTVGSASCMGSQPYYIDDVALSKNFWYNPRLGNLLLDVRVYQGARQIPPFDAAEIAGDSVSRVYAGSVNATSGTTDTTGLVTFFAMAPLPTLQAYVTTTNYIVLRWLTQPTNFVLQQSALLGTNSSWQILPGSLSSNIETENYRVPITPGVGAGFFQLAIPAGH